MKKAVLSIVYCKFFAVFLKKFERRKCGFGFDFLENNLYIKGRSGVLRAADGKILCFFLDFFVGKA
ncbi:MAG: hypothetical protein IKW18_04710 [Clostridia bacterium]|nr:hypothetical protein [Clostridia bacterium]